MFRFYREHITLLDHIRVKSRALFLGQLKRRRNESRGGIKDHRGGNINVASNMNKWAELSPLSSLHRLLKAMLVIGHGVRIIKPHSFLQCNKWNLITATSTHPHQLMSGFFIKDKKGSLEILLLGLADLFFWGILPAISTNIQCLNKAKHPIPMCLRMRFQKLTLLLYALICGKEH